MKKEITITIATLGFISSAVGVTAYTVSDNYICDVAGQKPLVINLSDEFAPELIESQKIESLTFSVDCKTNLDDERAYLTQGIVYYQSDGEYDSRSFADLVSVTDSEFKNIQKQDSVCTEITVGTHERPLNADLDKDITIEWTWITADVLKMYNLSVTTSDGLTYVIVDDEDYYTVEISEKMEEDKPQTKSDNTFMFPLKGRYCVTSVYGWDDDRWHDALDIYSYTDDNIYSACSGTVEYASWNGGYGNYIRVLDDNGEYKFCYGHLSEIDVEVGQHINMGDKLGEIGSSGMSTGIHLDFSTLHYNEECNVADVVGVPNNYGDYPAITEDIIEDNQLAIKCLSINKEFEAGYLGANAIRPNDSGAVALGLCQWNGSNGRDMLQYLFENNRDTYINIAHKYNDGYVGYLEKNDNWWNHHVIEDHGNEYNFYAELLDNDRMIELQYEYAINYMKSIIEDAHEHGITDDKAIMIFSKCYNVLPYGGVAEAMRNGKTSFDEACNLLLSDTNTNRHDEIINYVNNEISFVTVDSLKGER